MTSKALATIATLAVALAWISAPASAAKLCEGKYTTNFVWGSTKSGARSRARLAWIDWVRANKGADYTDWKIAKAKSFMCGPCKKSSGGTCGGKNGKGQICLAQARPCKRAN